jgi:subtilisin family serine protease
VKAFKNIILLLIIVVSSTIGLAQKTIGVESSIELKIDLGKASSQSLFHVYVKGEQELLTAALIELDGKVKYKYKDYFAIVIPKESLEALLLKNIVESIRYEGAKGTSLLSASREQTNVDDVHLGLGGLPDAYTGEGVIIGVIDAGLDLDHPDFKDANGNTRVLEYWDQTLPFSFSNTPSFGYGQVHDSAEINAGLCPSVDQALQFGHGTNVTGIAAGNGQSNTEFTGVAPEANIIVVSSNFNAFGWTNTVADAVSYIFSRADYYGMPCVINASLGTYQGSHDALDFAAQLIESEITSQSGRAMVCAAGNSGNYDPYHLGYNVTADTGLTWFELPANSQVGNTSLYLEVFGDTGRFENVQFGMSADQTNGNYSFQGESNFFTINDVYNSSLQDTLWSFNGDYLGELDAYADSANGVYRLQIYLHNIDSVNLTYGLQVTGSGRFDLWSGSGAGINGRAMTFDSLPSTIEYPRILRYKFPDLNQTIVSSWACSDKVITVGNYTNRVQYTDVDENIVTVNGQTQGALAVNSSNGPSRLGFVKPEVTAPGDNTLTAGAAWQIANQLASSTQRNRVAIGGMHNRAGGTSMASPVVAGIGALFFEKCEGKNWEDFKTAITQNTIIDQSTGSVPNNGWGYGKIDALASLKSTTPRPALIADGNDFCAGEPFPISLISSFDSVLWNTGDTTQEINASESGLYFASVINSDGCEGYSDSLSAYKREIPSKPLFKIHSLDFEACPNTDHFLEIDDEFGAYEWNNGAYTHRIQVTESGEYWCFVSNFFNCRISSDTINVNFFDESPKPLLNLKSDGNLYAIVDTNCVSEFHWYFDQEIIDSAFTNSYTPERMGVYGTGYTDTNGCKYDSEMLTVYALGNKDVVAVSQIQAFPNPMNEQLNINAQEPLMDVTFFNQLGQVIVLNFDSNQEIFDVSQLPPGLYFVKVSTENYSETIRLVK